MFVLARKAIKIISLICLTCLASINTQIWAQSPPPETGLCTVACVTNNLNENGEVIPNQPTRKLVRTLFFNLSTTDRYKLFCKTTLASFCKELDKTSKDEDNQKLCAEVELKNKLMCDQEQYDNRYVYNRAQQLCDILGAKVGEIECTTGHDTEDTLKMQEGMKTIPGIKVSDPSTNTIIQFKIPDDVCFNGSLSCPAGYTNFGRDCLKNCKQGYVIGPDNTCNLEKCDGNFVTVQGLTGERLCVQKQSCGNEFAKPVTDKDNFYPWCFRKISPEIMANKSVKENNQLESNTYLPHYCNSIEPNDQKPENILEIQNVSCQKVGTKCLKFDQMDLYEDITYPTQLISLNPPNEKINCISCEEGYFGSNKIGVMCKAVNEFKKCKLRMIDVFGNDQGWSDIGCSTGNNFIDDRKPNQIFQADWIGYKGECLSTKNYVQPLGSDGKPVCTKMGIGLCLKIGAEPNKAELFRQVDPIESKKFGPDNFEPICAGCRSEQDGYTECLAVDKTNKMLTRRISPASGRDSGWALDRYDMYYIDSIKKAINEGKFGAILQEQYPGACGTMVYKEQVPKIEYTDVCLNPCEAGFNRLTYQSSSKKQRVKSMSCLASCGNPVLWESVDNQLACYYKPYKLGFKFQNGRDACTTEISPSSQCTIASYTNPAVSITADSKYFDLLAENDPVGISSKNSIIENNYVISKIITEENSQENDKDYYNKYKCRYVRNNVWVLG
ncbi:MAG: hypothetical protein KBD64_04515, partial [Gammaproteobacteria bacterium]|nr:hypothetical protein [Gammaproteobacteria bacterium]